MVSAPLSPDTVESATPLTRIDVPLKILVVDDSHLVHEVMTDKLHKLAGHYRIETEHASCGEEALERLRTTPYDIVFLDVEMPGIGGHEACRRIKAHSRKTRVAMLSSLAQLQHRDAAFSAGCDHYLEKPPKEQVLEAVVRVAGLRKQLYQD